MILPCLKKLQNKISRLLRKKPNKKLGIGYTLIELMVVITIISVITGIGVASYNNYNSRRVVEKAAEELKVNIRLAQSRAINNEKDTRCGTAILEGWYVEHKGSTSYQLYCKCGATEYRPTSPITITGVGVTLASFSTFGFKPLIGNTTLTADTTITVSGSGKTSTLSITKAGDISLSNL